jgi:hypothetical protein
MALLVLALFFFACEIATAYGVIKIYGLVPKVVMASLALGFAVFAYYVLTLPATVAVPAYTINAPSGNFIVQAYNITYTQSAQSTSIFYLLAQINTISAFVFWFLSLVLGFTASRRRNED